MILKETSLFRDKPPCHQQRMEAIFILMLVTVVNQIPTYTYRHHVIEC
jgi:hypothetical protein